MRLIDQLRARCYSACRSAISSIEDLAGEFSGRCISAGIAIRFLTICGNCSSFAAIPQRLKRVHIPLGPVSPSPNNARWCYAVLVIIGLAVAGCDSTDPFPVTESYPAFVATGKPSQCAGDCIPITAYLGRAALGLDPNLAREPNADPQVTFRTLQAESEASSGAIRSVTVPRVIDELQEGPIDPVVLEHVNGHLYMLIGSIQVEGQLLCQLIHGSRSVSLVAKKDILRAGFKQAWQFEKTAEGVPIRVGSGSLRVNEVYHNFGEVMPDEVAESNFVITNVGNSTLILGKSHTSCSCTTTNAEEGTLLPPGKTMDVGVTIQTTNSASLDQVVHLSFSELGSGASVQSHLLSLFLFGNQLRSMQVAPKRLDFGVVVSGESHSRTVRLSEVATDRFVITEIDLGELPIVYKIEGIRDKGGLAVYRVHLELNVDQGLIGKQTGKLVVTTDSKVRPQVTVPVEFEIAPSVWVKPSVVSFGTVEVGQPREQQVRIYSQNGKPLTVEVESTPDECSVEFDRKSNPLDVTVRLKLNKPGVWQGTVKIRVRSSSTKKELIEIQCFGYGTKSS